jgi:hypothetical protein
VTLLESNTVMRTFRTAAQNPKPAVSDWVSVLRAAATGVADALAPLVVGLNPRAGCGPNYGLTSCPVIPSPARGEHLAVGTSAH